MAQIISLVESTSVRSKLAQLATASRNRDASRRIRLTDGRIETAPIPTGQSIYIYDLDVPGLSVRVTPNGIRTFVLVKKISGKAQRITLGRWPGLGLSDARKAAKRIHGEVAAGEDPVARRKAARQRAETCDDLWPTYLGRIKRKNRTWKRDEHRWQTYIAPAIGRMPLTSVKTSDCQKIIDRAGAKYPVGANRLAALLGAFFAFALKSERIVRNPGRGLSRYPEQPRDRFLSGEELRKFLSGCETAPQPWGDFFSLLLWTGARKGAVMAMGWSDVDLEGAVWRIPAVVAKNKQVAAVPLVPPALDVLRRRLAFRDNCPWVFPATSKTGHVAHAAKAWSSLTKTTGLTGLRPHDLRRTIGSWLAAAGASSFVIQKALTHQSAASAKAYAHLDVEAVRVALSAVTDAMQRRAAQ
jgi:integrase